MDISVVIPSYNSATTIIESMDSVVRECSSNLYSWELIVVDDQQYRIGIVCNAKQLADTVFTKERQIEQFLSAIK